MFEQPIKGDLDRSLSRLMHDARHKLIEKCSKIKSDAIVAGVLGSERVIVTAAAAADAEHKDAMSQAAPILLDFIERMQRPAGEITGWARPHLENLGNTLLGVVPPSGLPNQYQRIVQQYRIVFQQRLEGVLRDIEIGYVKGSGFAGSNTMESEEWITAAEAVRLLTPAFNNSASAAQNAICKRANNKLIRARAEKFIRGDNSFDNLEVPRDLWWSEGGESLEQNWATGDFSTWIDHRVQLQAFGVSFFRPDIEKMMPKGSTRLHQLDMLEPRFLLDTVDLKLGAS